MPGHCSPILLIFSFQRARKLGNVAKYSHNINARKHLWLGVLCQPVFAIGKVLAGKTDWSFRPKGLESVHFQVARLRGHTCLRTGSPVILLVVCGSALSAERAV